MAIDENTEKPLKPRAGGAAVKPALFTVIPVIPVIAVIAASLVTSVACSPSATAVPPVASTSATAAGRSPFDEGYVSPEPSIVITDAMGSPHIGDAAPDFDLPDQDGKHVTIASARGSVVVLAFVARSVRSPRPSSLT